MTLAAYDDANFQTYFEENFQPYAVMADVEPVGLFTGYYEASLRGSREKKEPYVVPLYVRPDDLVMVDLGAFREELKGQRIAGRVEDGNLKPYETREEIVAGKWPHNDKVVVWVDDPVDAFYVQIQGSGVVTFEDGSTMRIGYAGQNGHPYTAIGKELIVRGALTKENVSMASIRDWLEAHKDQADEIMNTNKSYVFFTELKENGPVGGEGVVLTPGRSLAVDRALMPYGVPLWVDIETPVAGTPDLKRMMIAQDTGGAIRGPVRGDVFWGYGPEAEAMAGPMKSKGRYWVLVPKRR
jgi:membrane-bound lytic murein transglycosylase A